MSLLVHGRLRRGDLDLMLDPEAAVAIGVLLLAVSFAVLVTLRGRWLTR